MAGVVVEHILSAYVWRGGYGSGVAHFGVVGHGVGHRHVEFKRTMGGSWETDLFVIESIAWCGGAQIPGDSITAYLASHRHGTNNRVASLVHWTDCTSPAID